MAKKEKRTLNAFGLYLEKKSVNKAEVCKRTGIHPTRMTWLCYAPILYIRSSELQLISLAINVNPAEMQRELFGHLQLKEPITPSERVIARLVLAFNTNDFGKKYDITTKEIPVMAEIMSFCEKVKTDDEIAEHIGLKRKSSKFNRILRACVDSNWLTFNQNHSVGKATNTYIITVSGTAVLGKDA